MLDRNGNGAIDNGSELFGNFTPLGPGTVGPRAQNGFDALAWFDKPLNGGNGDGEITEADPIFERLRVWVDANHNGVSEPGELKTLRECGIISIGLNTRESRRQDEFGNVYKFRSVMRVLADGQVRRSWAIDVFLTTGSK